MSCHDLSACSPGNNVSDTHRYQATAVTATHVVLVCQICGDTIRAPRQRTAK